MKLKKILLFLIVIFLGSPAVVSQIIDSTGRLKPVEKNNPEEIAGDFVEELPDFPGGEEALFEYMAKHTVYPEKARRKGIQGTVYVQFVVEKDGTITNVEIKKSSAPELNEAALAVVKSMPPWQPGKQRGKPVRVMFVLPIRFQL